MEIIHLRGTAPEPWALDLSPRLTIVHGLTEPVATAVRRAVDALVKGRARDLVAGGVTGKVSVGGEALDLDQVEAQLRDLVPAAMLTAADVADPGAALVQARQRAFDDELARASEALQTAEAELVRVRADWHEALGERTDTMRAGLRERDAAAVELAAARQRMSEAPSPEPDEPTPTGAGSGGPDPELARLIEERAAAAHLARDAAAWLRRVRPTPTSTPAGSSWPTPKPGPPWPLATRRRRRGDGAWPSSAPSSPLSSRASRCDLLSGWPPPSRPPRPTGASLPWRRRVSPSSGSGSATWLPTMMWRGPRPRRDRRRWTLSSASGGSTSNPRLSPRCGPAASSPGLPWSCPTMRSRGPPSRRSGRR